LFSGAFVFMPNIDFGACRKTQSNVCRRHLSTARHISEKAISLFLLEQPDKTTSMTPPKATQRSFTGGPQQNMRMTSANAPEKRRNKPFGPQRGRKPNPFMRFCSCRVNANDEAVGEAVAREIVCAEQVT
jgi:hypothetical protein